MADSQTAALYFRRKFSEWKEGDGSAVAHIQRLGRTGLAGEFRRDPSFRGVCEFVQLAGRAQLRSAAYKGAEGVFSDLLGVPLAPTIEIVLAAVADACGYNTEANDLATAAIAAFAIAIIFGIVVALLSD